MLTFSVVDPLSLESVKSKWYPEITESCPGIPFVLVGANVDLREDAATVERLKATEQEPIASDVGLALATEFGAANYLEVTTVTQQGLEAAFEECVRDVLYPMRASLKQLRGNKSNLNYVEIYQPLTGEDSFDSKIFNISKCSETGKLWCSDGRNWGLMTDKTGQILSVCFD
jgi:GTPase SAR1 family protein